MHRASSEERVAKPSSRNTCGASTTQELDDDVTGGPKRSRWLDRLTLLSHLEGYARSDGLLELSLLGRFFL